jgi:anaerobic magnesium-protoporphyrin IX monomethyl ester cyclase
MKVVLVQARDPGLDQVWFEDMARAAIEMTPLGLCSIASVLRRAGHQVAIFDFNTINEAKEREHAEQQIVAMAPQVVGISTMTPSYPHGVIFARKIRSVLGQDVKLMMGGYHVSFVPEEPLRAGIVDVVVRGEAESIICELTDALVSTNDRWERLSKVPGVSFFKEGKTIHNPPQLLRVTNLDALPFPDRDLLNLAAYRNPGTIVSSRGCIAKCIFCSAGALGRIATRSPENTIDEVNYLVSKYAFKHLFFVDNTFTADRARTYRMLEMLQSRRNGVMFTIETRAPQVDNELIKRLADAGCVAIQFGVESGNEGVLSRIKKGITLAQVEAAVRMCLENRIKTVCSFIVGHPFDTLSTIRDTIAFSKKLKRMGAIPVLAICVPYPGTDIYRRRKEYGISILNWDYSSWGGSNSVMSTPALSRGDIDRLFREALWEGYAV